MVHINRLSALKVKQALKPGMYADGLGLYLQVRPGNAKSWIFRYRMNGKLRDMGLGPLHSVSLAAAREKAAECRDVRLKGLDPLDELRKSKPQDIPERPALTFEQCAEAYIEAHRSGWKNEKHAAQWTATLKTYAYPVFKKTDVANIDLDLILKVLQPIWLTKNETASRVRGRIERILDWARIKGYRDGENPARWHGHLEHLLAKRSRSSSISHFAALPIDETPAFVAALRRETSVTARAFEFCILTATRTSETIEMRWDEVDEGGRLWTIPAQRMKAGREHRVPLSDRAVGILKEMKLLRISNFVFPGARSDRPLSNMAFLQMLPRLGHPKITVHGFRSTFRDWASERTDFQSEVIEMALAHTISNKVEAAYRRGDLFEKRHHLAAAWTAFCGNTIASTLTEKRSDRTASYDVG